MTDREKKLAVPRSFFDPCDRDPRVGDSPTSNALVPDLLIAWDLVIGRHFDPIQDLFEKQRSHHLRGG